ncbi:MAG: peptidoglycan-binding protein [Spiribacter salinus]|uniref:Peptidoglycan-binding protein n=1 Tax=Spiribacter salinus TaxID=1335746 RepID=A0A540V8I5_9GAMM|nr:MAG: peptidoglycan-binding protein [Spiribacter salinus]
MTEDTFDVLPLISGADVAGLMRVICTQNADTSFEVAVDAALDLFYPARVKVDSPLLELKHNGQTVAVREVTLAQVQAVLSERGFYESDVDGAYGPATRAAVQRFQASRNLKETGLPDADTLIALLLAE